MNIFYIEIRNSWKSILKWTIVTGGITFMMLAFFPAMQTESMRALAGAKMEGLDPEVLMALGLSELTDFTVITNFFGYVLQYITLAIMVFTAQMSVSILVKEETDGTIEYLYSKPISRSELYLQKFLANIVSFIFLLLVLGCITIIGYISFSDTGITASIKEAGIFYGSIFYVGMVFMAVGILLSAVQKSNKGSSGIAISIVFGTFLLGIMGLTNKELNFLSYLSPLDWIKTQKLMTDGIRPNEWLIGISVIIVCTVVSYLIYKRKDLHI
jgi:ABC-2 type transport system permease protein